MATTVARLEAILAADTKSFDLAMVKSEGKLRTVSKAAGIAGLALGGALVLGARAGVKELMQAQKASAQTEAVIKSTGGAAHVSAAQVRELSNSLLKKTGIDDEVVLSGANMLLTFTKIRNETGKSNDIFTQATKVGLDMSTALQGAGFEGGNLKTTMIRLGKALQDPVAGLTSLKRVGVDVSAIAPKIMAIMGVSAQTAAKDMKKAVTELASAQLAHTAAVRGASAAQESLVQANQAVAASAHAVVLAQRGVKESLYQLKEAQVGVKDSLYALSQAQRSVKDAEASLSESQVRAKDAQKALSEARRQAVEQIQAVKDALRDASLNEEQATINLQRSRINLMKVNKDANATDLDREQAALDVQRAEIDLANAHKDRMHAVDDLNKSDEEGVKKNKGVVDAQKNLIDAQKQVKDSARGVKDAQRGVEQAERGVVAAHKAVTDAATSVSDAQYGVQQASLGVRDAQVAAKFAADDYAAAQAKVEATSKDVTKAQKDVAKAQAETEKATHNTRKHLVEAQKLIIRELRKEFGGSAQEFANTIPGQLAAVRESFNNLAASLTQNIIPVMDQLTGYLQTFLDYLGRHPKQAKVFVASMTAMATALVIASGAQIVMNLAVLANPYVAAGAAIIAFIAILVVLENKYKAVTKAVKFLRENWYLLLLPLGLFPAAVGLAIKSLNDWIPIIGTANKALDKMKDLVGWVVDKLSAGWGKAMDAAHTAVKGLNSGLHAMVRAMDKIVDAFKWIIDHAKSIGGAVGSVAGKVAGLFGDGSGPAKAASTKQSKEVSKGAASQGQAFNVGRQLWDEIGIAQKFGLHVTSGYRPGAVTKHGTPSDHGRNPSAAIDVSDGSASATAAKAGFFRSLIGRKEIRQAFYDPLGSIFNGVWNSYREGGHTDHVHVAEYDKGGWLQPGLTLAMNNTGRAEPVGGNVTIPVSIGGEHVATVVFDMLRRKARVFESRNGRRPF